LLLLRRNKKGEKAMEKISGRSEEEKAAASEAVKDEGMRIEIESKAGTFNVSISGTQEEPKIEIRKFVATNGMTIGGSAILQHRKGQQPGLFLRVRTEKVYIQCPVGVEKIRQEIATLPHKKYWARKVKETIYADGYNVKLKVWKFDCACWTEKSTLISDTEMGRFLDAKDIREIEICDAVKMWADEKEKAHIKANEDGGKRARAIFDDDEGEAGYWQACENPGIPKFLR